MTEKEWAEVGKKTFARFYELEIKQVETMAENANQTFFEMIAVMDKCLSAHENYYEKKEYIDIIRSGRQKISRFDHMDFWDEL